MMMTTTPRTATLKLINCQDCPFHANVLSPYTGDSFDDGIDRDTICVHPLATPCERYGAGSGPSVDGRIITGSNRPWQMRENSDIPQWCPLLNTTTTTR
jgi:hypothetical protein